LWDKLLGEVGLSAKKARRLTWVEVDHILWGYEVRLQKEMEGHRLTAHQVHCSTYQDPLPLTEFHHLPLIDAPAGLAQKENQADQATFLERLAARGLQPVQHA
jgi:hypothetical protein